MEVLERDFIDNAYRKNHGSVVFLSRFEVARDDIEHAVYIPYNQKTVSPGLRY